MHIFEPLEPSDPSLPIEEQPSEERIYPKTLKIAEDGVAKCIHLLVRSVLPPLKIHAEHSLHQFERDSEMNLPTGQRKAVLNALANPVSVITGGPGVGKTTMAAAVVRDSAVRGAFDRIGTVYASCFNTG